MKSSNRSLPVRSLLACAFATVAAAQNPATPLGAPPPLAQAPAPAKQSEAFDVTAGDDGHTVVVNAAAGRQTVAIHIANKSAEKITLSHAAFGTTTVFFPIAPATVAPGELIDLPILVDFRSLNLPLTAPVIIIAKRNGHDEQRMAMLTFTAKDLLTFGQPTMTWNLGAKDPKRLTATNIPPKHTIVSATVNSDSFAATVKDGQITITPTNTTTVSNSVMSVLMEPNDLPPAYVFLAVVSPPAATIAGPTPPPAAPAPARKSGTE